MGNSAKRESDTFINPKALMAIQNLELRARVVVEGFASGLHRSPYHGFSVEFTEYRDYSSGDDPRFLDWRLLARTDRYYIKKFEDETNVRCHLLVDNSRSMEFGSVGYTKSDYARTLAASLARFLDLQGDATGAFVFADRVVDYLPARHRPGHLRHLTLLLSQAATGASTSLEAPLQRAVEMLRKRGLVVLISDLLAPIASLEKHLGNLRACRHEVIVFQVIDPKELRFEFSGASMFRDLETGQRLYVDPAALVTEYRAKLKEHMQAVERTCQKLGIAYALLGTDRPLEWALFDFLKARMQRNKRSSARGVGAGRRG